MSFITRFVVYFPTLVFTFGSGVLLHFWKGLSIGWSIAAGLGIGLVAFVLGILFKTVQIIYSCITAFLAAAFISLEVTNFAGSKLPLDGMLWILSIQDWIFFALTIILTIVLARFFYSRVDLDLGLYS